VAVAAALVLVTASWELSSGTSSPGMPPLPPPPPLGPPSLASVTLTSVVGVYDYGNGSHSGWLGTSGDPITIVSGVSGAPPYSFAAGTYQDWKIQLTNFEPEMHWLYDFAPVTGGVTWVGAVGGTYLTFQPDQSLVVEIQFVLPYQNYTGSLTFWFTD